MDQLELNEEASNLDALRDVVRRVWGFDELRPLQAEAMSAALQGRDALVVLATGAGKSLCYQAPALVRPGLTAVVSPLISLMKDQIDGLVANGVAAAMMTSAQDGYEKSQVYNRLDAGELKLLFVAPERLAIPGFFDRLEGYGLSALVIDEAHCISHWGHDFRPEYRKIGELRARRPDLLVQAYTATATPQVRADIVEQLALRDPVVLVGGFDRPNLSYRFLPRGDLLSQTLAVIRRHQGGAGIVYCLRRKDVEKLARELAGEGVSCLPYHAGMTPETRKDHQERFLSESIQVIVATVAFGMGIDRTDVRFVVHASLPKGVEQFSQETGRAGRDGLASECVMFYSGSDYAGWRSLAERSETSDLDGQLRRLGQMFGFATSAACRHRYLVEHFGQAFEPGEDGCGACDVCLGEMPVLEDSQVVAQKILSCVVRCHQSFGAGHVADVLRGADTERIRRIRHHELSTYGLLKDHTAREIRHWIEQLVGLDHLRVAEGPYPTLFLSETGVAVMKAEAPVTLFASVKPAASARKRRSLAELAAEEGAPPADQALFDELRDLRRQLAVERGVPPYVIFNDRTLSLLSSYKPRTPEEFLGIKGVGEKKAADLGPTFLAAIAEFGLDAGEEA
jgi:ATP-dependent DNA helicase RecQ